MDLHIAIRTVGREHVVRDVDVVVVVVRLRVRGWRTRLGRIGVDSFSWIFCPWFG